MESRDGLPESDDTYGRALTYVLSIARPVEYKRVAVKEATAEAGLSAEESVEMEDRLRALSYLG